MRLALLLWIGRSGDGEMGGKTHLVHFLTPYLHISLSPYLPIPRSPHLPINPPIGRSGVRKGGVHLIVQLLDWRIICTIMAMMRSYSLYNVRPDCAVRYSHLTANCNQTCVSEASVSASDNLLMKAASYRRFRHASARLAQTDREARRIWSVNEYVSSFGNRLENSKTDIAAAKAH